VSRVPGLPAASGAGVVVVGTGLAGLSALEAFRELGYAGRLVGVGDEGVPPIDRPPLSKEYLAGEWDEERVVLRSSEELAQLDVEWRTERAVGVDPGRRRVRLEGGDEVAYDGLVVATGASPRRLAGLEGERISVLRTLADARRLRAALEELGPRAGRLAVVGGGFIGVEVATTARAHGVAVTLLEAVGRPLERVLGGCLGEAVARTAEAAGVEVRSGEAVVGLESDRPSEPLRLRLRSGALLEADWVVVAVGVVPATAWLGGSFLQLEDGVVTDDRLRAGDGVVACGDLARYLDRRLGRHVRIEHWTNAVESGRAAARGLLLGDAAESFVPTPYVWSDHFGGRLQIVGWPEPDHRVEVVEGRLEEPRYVAHYLADGRLRGVVCANWPARLGRYRRLFADASPDFPLADGLLSSAPAQTSGQG